MDRKNAIAIRQHELALAAERSKDPGPVDPETTRSPEERYHDMACAIGPLLLRTQKRESGLRGESRTPSIEIIPAVDGLSAMTLHLVMGSLNGPKIQAVWEYADPPEDRSKSRDDRAEASRESFALSQITLAPQKIGIDHFLPSLNRLEHSVQQYVEAFGALPKEQQAAFDVVGEQATQT